VIEKPSQNGPKRVKKKDRKEKEKESQKKRAQESEIGKQKSKEASKALEVDILSFNNFSDKSADTSDSFQDFFVETETPKPQPQPQPPQHQPSPTQSKPAKDIMSLFEPPSATSPSVNHASSPSPVPSVSVNQTQGLAQPKKKAITTSDLLSLY